MNSNRAKWIVLGGLAVLLIAFLAFRYFSGRDVTTRLDAIRAEGLPASPEELDQWYSPVPPAQNQALAILAAAKLRIDPPREADPNLRQLGRLDAGHPFSPKMEEAIHAYIKLNEPALESIHQAAELTASRYPVDLSAGAAAPLPHIAQVQGLVQMLRIEAVHFSHLKKPNEAVRSLTTAFSTIHSLRNEPLLISDYVRLASLAITISALERLLSEHPLTHAQLNELSEKLALAETVSDASLVRAFIGERAIGISIFSLSGAELDRLGSNSNENDRGLLRSVTAGIHRASGLHRRDLTFYLGKMADLIAFAGKPFPEAWLLSQKFDSELVAHYSDGLDQFSSARSRNLLVPISGAFQKKAIAISGLRSTRIALAIERFRLDHKDALPDDLQTLVPKYLVALPTDPFEDTNLTYERIPGKGYRVFSPTAARILKSGSKFSDEGPVKILR